MPRPIDRRFFLRGSGCALALPFLDAMSPAASKAAASPRRLVAVGTPFGFDPAAFVPTAAGRDYALPPHLELIKDFRNDFTVVSGLSHPNTGNGGHKSEAVMLTGAPYPDYSYNLKNTISVDQRFAAHTRGQTRYDSLVLTTYYGSLSVTGNGVSIPPLDRPSQVYAKLFLAGSPQQAEEEVRQLAEGRSVLDFVSDQSKRFSRTLGPADKARLDEYYESVRDVERQMQMAGEWVNRPKPKAPAPPPQDVTTPGQQAKKFALMLDMVHLALLTDSTRAVTIKTFGDHHDLSHHGKEPAKLSECRQVEVDLLKAVGAFLGKLKGTTEGSGGTLLDATMVLLTSNLRDGNTHWTHDLPVLLAGGGFKHGQHLAFNKPYLDVLKAEADPKAKPVEKKTPAMGPDQAPLANLFTSMLQRAGVPVERFSSATGTLTGLEMA